MLLTVVACSMMSALAAEPANCNANFTSCQIPENVVLRLPFTAFAGDVIVQEPTSTTVSDVFRIFNNLLDTGGGTGLGNLAILYSGDDNMPLPDPSTFSFNAVIIKEAAGGSTSYLGNGTTYSLETTRPTLSIPQVVVAAPGKLTQFVIGNSGGIPATVSVRPFFSGACFKIAPGSPQQVTIPALGGYGFVLDAGRCPFNAAAAPANSLIIVEVAGLGNSLIQVRWNSR
jgi:hypothetical protein